MITHEQAVAIHRFNEVQERTKDDYYAHPFTTGRGDVTPKCRCGVCVRWKAGSRKGQRMCGPWYGPGSVYEDGRAGHKREKTERTQS